MKPHRILVMAAVALLLIVGLTKGLAIPKVSPREAILREAKKIVLALKEKNLGQVAAAMASQGKLRFSPYGTIQEEQDQVFSRDKVENLFADQTMRTWGYYDGSGEPIKKTFSEYFTEFVYDVDFAAAPKISFDERLGQGNTLNNISDVYPKTHIVEFHFPGLNPQYEGLDWKSLRLVFEEKGGKRFLAAIVHDQWTI